ncbi:MAG: hypothetical protein QM820_16555 [Minicystis sp.]
MSKSIFSRRSKRFLTKNIAFAISLATLGLTAAEARAQSAVPLGTTRNIGKLVEPFTKSTKYGAMGAQFDASDDISSDTSGGMKQIISAGASVWLFGKKYPLVDFDLTANGSASTASAHIVTTLLGDPVHFSYPEDFGSLTASLGYCTTEKAPAEQIMVGPVPVVMELGAGLCPSIGLTGSASTASGQTTFEATMTPSIAVGATAYIGIGTEVASAGVKGTLNLLEVSTPIKNTMVLAGSSLTDTTTGDVKISFLSGEIDLYAKAGWGMFSVEYDYELCSWPGYSWTFAGFSDQKPIAKELSLDIKPGAPYAAAVGRYVYSGPSESNSIVRFYVASDASGTKPSLLFSPPPVNDTVTLSLTPTLANQYLRFCVTPRSVSSTGAEVCSAWTPVGPLLSLYKDASYSGGYAVFPYKTAATGTCFNLSSYSFNDALSSFRWQYDADMAKAELVLYKDAGCSGAMARETIDGNASSGSIDQSSVGGAYGSSWNDEVSSFRIIWNHDTVAKDVRIAFQDMYAKARYTYADAANLPESGTLYQWQRADDIKGTNAVTILPYSPVVQQKGIIGSDEGKYLRLCIKASNGIAYGDEVCSDWSYIGKLVTLYKDSNFGGSAVSFPYQQWPSGTCITLDNYGWSDITSAYRVSFDGYTPATGDTSTYGIKFFSNANCSGAMFTSTFGTSEGTNAVSSLGSTWNDQVTSFQIVYRRVEAREAAVTWDGAYATPSYTFFDSMSLPESGTTYQWERADDTAGTNTVAVQSYGTTAAYAITPADQQKYLRVCIKPSDGVMIGSQACSDWGSVGMLVTVYDQAGFAGNKRSFAYQHLNGACLKLSDYGMNAGVLSAIWASMPYTQPDDDETSYGTTLYVADDCTVEKTDEVNEPSLLLSMSPTTSGTDSNAGISIAGSVRSLRINYPHFDDASW